MARTARKAKPSEFQEESVSTGRIWGNERLYSDIYDRDLPRFNYESVRAMRFDAEVHAAVEFVLDAMLADGVETVAAVYEDDPEFELAEEISAFVRRNLLETCKFFLRTYKTLMRGAFTRGHKLGEIVLKLENEGIDAGKLVLDKIKVKPNSATGFVVNEYLDVIGIFAVYQGQSIFSIKSVSPENIVPLDKFVICTFETEDEDPRGVSQIKAAFEPACDNRETRAQYNLYRRKSAIRSYLAKFTEDVRDKKIPLKNADGTAKIVNGVQQTKTPATAAAETLSQMKNDTMAVFPFPIDIDVLDADGTGEQFERSYKINGQLIRKAILLQSGATGEADKGGLGKAGKEVDERVLNRRINSFRRDRELELYGLGKTLVELNYGRDKLHLTPAISLGDAEKSDFSALQKSYADAGYQLHESQFDEIDRKLGNPKRDMSQDNEDEQAAAGGNKSDDGGDDE